MCGRYSVALGDPAGLRRRFPLGDAVEIRRRFNVAPTDDVLAVTTTREGEPRGELLRWGLIPHWAKEASAGVRSINARAETLTERPAFREAFRRFRCLIPADGFYEWRREPDGRKQAFHITRRDGEPFAFAGLWSRWLPPGAPDSGEAIRSCTIITTRANSAIAPLHDRMPVILDPSAEEAWLDHDSPRGALEALLHGLAPDAVSLRAVGRAVNDVRYDGPDCLAPPEAATRSGAVAGAGSGEARQSSLF